MINEYLIQKKLGIGSYGTVYKVTKKNTNDFYVIKQISLFGLTPDEIKDVNLEAKILSSINSKYVVKYYDSFEEKNFLNIVMEYCDGEDLGQFIEEKKALNEPIKEDLIWNFFIKITLGLAAMHKSKILHRDLKALNIFMTKDLDVKIGDLGVSKMLNHSGSFAKTLIGTPYYLSPELCEEKPYNDKSDVWALGCILYELCTFKHPFNAKSQAALILKILKGTHDPIGNNYSNDLKNLVNSLFEKDAKKRPSCKQILHNNIIIMKAKQFGLFHMFTELYPELYNNIKNSSTFKNNKLIYCKNRYPRNYKMKNSIQKNNSIGNIKINNNNLDISNKNIKNIKKINKNNRIRHKSQFNSISTDSHSHNSIKNIFCRNNEKEIQLYNAKNLKNDFNNYNNVIEITDFNINANNNNNNSNNNINKNKIDHLNNNESNIISKPFVKKTLNKFPFSPFNKNSKNKIADNARYVSIEQYKNLLNKNNESKEKKTINKSCKSAKKLFINLNQNNNKGIINKRGTHLKTNKSSGKKKFIIQKSYDIDIRPENKNIKNNNENKYENKTYFNLNDISIYNINRINTNFNINQRNTNFEINNKSNIIFNNFTKIEGNDMNINNNYENQNKNQINFNESIEKFENKLKNYYQYSPRIQTKQIKLNNCNKNYLRTPNKENSLSDEILKLIDSNDNNNQNMNIAEEEHNKDKKKLLMEFAKNLNDYVPLYISPKYTRNNSNNKNVSKSDYINNNNNIHY